MADKELVRSVGSSTKRMQSARDVLLPKTEPTTVVPSTRLVDYKTYLELARSRTGNPLTEQDFEDLAGSKEVPRFYEQNDQLARQRFEEEQVHGALQRKYESGDRIAKFNEELTGRLQRTQEDLISIGQGEQLTAERYRNIAQTASALLFVEGDSDEQVAARRFAAQVFAEHGSRLSPHLDATLKPGWLAENSGLIEEILEETEPQGLDKIKDTGAKALSAVIDFPAVKIPLDTLQQLEQAWFHTATGLLGGIDQSLPANQRIDHLKHAGSSFLRGAGSLVTGGQGSIGIQPFRSVTLGDEVIPVDVDESGDANLREFLGLHPELGGTFGDIADLAGIILLDPTTYLSGGSRSAASLVTKALSGADSHIAQRVGRQLANGARLSNLDDTAQAAARAEFRKYQIDAVGNPRNSQLVRQSFRQNPANVLRTLNKRLRDDNDLLDSLIQTRTDRMTRAAERGIYPAIRIGGRTIIPMRKLYNSLGIIDTSIADDAAWALHTRSLAGTEDTDELLSFIQGFKGQEMNDELRAQIKGWSALANRISDDPESWLDDLLQRTEGNLAEEVAGNTAQVDQAFDEIEAFGRELLGDEAVAGWRPWYETQWQREFIDETEVVTRPRGAPTGGQGSVVHDLDEGLLKDATSMDDVGDAARSLYGDEAFGGVGNLDLAKDLGRKQRSLDPLLEQRGGQASRAAEGRRLGDELAGNTQLSMGVQHARQLAEGMPLKRVVDALKPADLSMEARARIAYNLEVFEEPLQWMLKDEILPRGLRSVATRDTVIGNLLRRVSDLGSPQAGIRRTGDLGEQGARDVKNLTAIERARRQLVTDHVNMLDLDRHGSSRLYRAAADEYDDNLDQFLNDVLSKGPDDITEASARASAAGQDNVARLVQSLERIRQDIFDLSVGAGFDEEALLAMKGYLPRTFSEEAVERAERAVIPGSATAREVGPLKKLGLIDESGNTGYRPNPLDQGGHARGRSFQRDLQDLYKVNDKAREQLHQAGLDSLDGFNLYEDNPIRAMLLRSREAHEAYAWMDMVKGMTDLTDLDGRPLAYMARTADDIPSVGVRMTADDATFAKKPANYMSRELPNGGRYWVRKEILGEIERVNNIMRNPAALNGFQKFLTGWNDVWGSWATVPLVGTAFHMRNAAGNMFNMMLAGVKNPAVLSDAFRLQRLNRKATLLMRSDGLQYREALTRAGADQGTADLLIDARKFGVLGAGQTSDIFTATDNLAGRGGKGAVLNPLDQRNIVLQQGRAFGQAVENNARLGLFIDSKTAKGMNSADAAENVRKFLFDYGDLTAFESGTMRMLSRFYCVPTDHRALTSDGWKTHDQLVPGETQMMVFDPETHHTRWEVLEGVAVFDHDQNINVTVQHGREILYTDDHRWPVERPSITTKHTYGTYTYPAVRGIKPFNEIKTGWTVPLVGEKHSFPEGGAVGVRLASIAGWVMTDGHRSKHQWFVYQKKQPYLDELRELLGTQDRECIHPQTATVRLPILLEDRKALQSLGIEDFPSFVSSLNEEEAYECWQAMLKAEGHTNGQGHWSFTQKPGPVLEAYQILAFSFGERIHTTTHSSGVRVINHGNINRMKLTNHFHRRRYTGQVWCPRTPTGTWVMEHDGFVTPTGNTFARKNTALQVRMLMTQPGRVHNAQRITDEFTDQVMGGLGFTSEGSPEPGINEAGERIPDWVQPTLRMFRDSEGGLTIAGIDSPLGAAADVVDNLTAILKIPPALVLQHTADGEFEREQRGDQFRDQIGDALSLFSGGPVEGVKTLFEFGTGEDLFTGGSLSDIDRNWMDSLFRFTDAVVPVLGKIDREAEYLGGYEALGILQDEDRPDRNQGLIRLMNFFLGLTVLPNLSDQDQITRNLNSLSYELNQSLSDIEQDLEDSGIEPMQFEDLQKAGDAYYHDKAYEFLLYNTLEGTPLTAEQRQELNRMAPAEVLEAAGVNVPDAERAAWDLQEKARRIREFSTVLQANGIEVTDEMIDALLLRESGARIADVKGLGIEPSFTSNLFAEGGDPEETERLRKEQSVQQLTALSELFGVSIQQLQQRYPLMQEAERIASQMRAVGRTDSEIVAELTEKLSRQERALLFGEGSLESEYSYSELTPQEVIEFQQKAARADAELRVILQIVSGRQPTQYELNEWLSEVLFLVPEQEKLGFDNYRPPSRENITTDEVYDRRLAQKLEAVQQSTEFLQGV